MGNPPLRGSRYVCSNSPHRVPRVRCDRTVVGCGRSDDAVRTRAEAGRCWSAGVELMVVGVGGEVAGDVWAMRELRTVSRAQSAIGTTQPRPRRLFLSANYESLGNTRQPVTDALCASTITHTVSLSLSLS